MLQFKFDAGTSRGILREKSTWYIKIWDDKNPSVVGIGEAGPLVKLSIDDLPNFEEELAKIISGIDGVECPTSINDVYLLTQSKALTIFPSIKFALETALLDLLNGGVRQIFRTSFSEDEEGISCNGLIWMGDLEDMLLQITSKIDQGYDCIKMKIGSLNFEKECDILQYVRRKYYRSNITLRVDANGAFNADEALDKLNVLANYNLHSIEQPIAKGQEDLMRQLCKYSPVPIALDEELIGVVGQGQKRKLLEFIQPHYIILKPTLLGGFYECEEWIALAEELKIGWWMTSALESNIGLNAVSQFTARYSPSTHQGLGTGQLYHNNISSPLEMMQGKIFYRKDKRWSSDLDAF